MDSEGSVTHWIQDLRHGDKDAAQAIWDRYFTRLVRLANARLNASRNAALIEGGDDAALSAFGSLFEGLKGGKFEQLSDREDLWKLMVTITARKACDYIERARAEKRGGGRLVHESDLRTQDDDSNGGGFANVVGKGPDPAVSAMVLEQCHRLLSALPDDECRDIAVWKMEGYTNDDIAEKLDCSRRKVSYRLELIRLIWEKKLK